MLSTAGGPTPPEEPWVWVPTLPGWIEIAAFETDDAAREHWQEMVEPVREHIGDEHTDDLYRMLGGVRAEIAGAPVSSAGLVITAVEDEMVVWTFSTAVETIDTGELNPAGLVERGVAGVVESTEDVTFADGRRGILLLMATEAAATESTPSATLSQCTVTVSLPGRPHDVVVVSASSTSRSGRDLLAMAAVSIADGIVVDAEPPPDARERGVLAGPPDLAS